ncbi:hypothetical protein JMJ35_009163 [Cladonia borealis]|uniref:Uncharacterized protein n=1 Tax=Cladonia borealis TaxID=184061 RepID=A0AA39V214_9LECA|nr:hypothetical protein JMJ35_009163 [Cladonia borealis]
MYRVWATVTIIHHRTNQEHRQGQQQIRDAILHFEGVDDPLSSEGTIPFSPSGTWREQPFAVVGTLGTKPHNEDTNFKSQKSYHLTNITRTSNMYPKMPFFQSMPINLLLLNLFNLAIAQGPASSITPYPASATGYSYQMPADPPLVITAYGPGHGCKGDYVRLEETLYGQLWSVQFQFLNLSRALKSSERLDYFNALPSGGAYNPAYDGDDVTCSYYQGTLRDGDNNENLDGGGLDQTAAGCQNIGAGMGCLKVWLPNAS